MGTQNLGSAIDSITFADCSQIYFQARGMKLNAIVGKQLNLFIPDASAKFLLLRRGRSRFAAHYRLPAVDQRSHCDIELASGKSGILQGFLDRAIQIRRYGFSVEMSGAVEPAQIALRFVIAHNVVEANNL